MHKVRCSTVALALVALVTHASAISITQFNSALTQNFDGLVNTGTSSVTPDGWTFLETGSALDATYGAGNGGSSTGNTYSFGASGSTDRAFGTLLSSSLTSSIGAVFTNDTGSTISSLGIQYTGEQWRLGSLGRVDRLDFAYSVDAGSLGTGTWQNVNALDFVAPLTTGSTGARDGNLAASQVLLSHVITGLSLADGASVWLRWTDFNATGSDDGLAIDNFSLTAIQPAGQTVPERLPITGMAIVLAGLAAVRLRAFRAARV